MSLLPPDIVCQASMQQNLWLDVISAGCHLLNDYECHLFSIREDLWFDDVDPDDIEATVGTEAADVMRKKQGIKKTTPEDTEKALVKDRAFEG